MLRSYLKVAFRSLFKNKTHSLINLFGLAIGLASCMFIALFIRNQLSYDDFHEKADRIYRVTHDERGRIERGRYMATVGPQVAPELAAEYPEVESGVRFRYTNPTVMAAGERRFYENGVVYTDSTLFDVFTYPLRLGNEETALDAPSTVVLTQEMAIKYFGDRNPLGQTIEMDGQPLTVTGVFKPIPNRSHLHFDFAVSFSTFVVPRGYPTSLDDWGWISFHNYILLRKGADPSELEAKFPDFIAKHWDQAGASRFVWRLQPLRDIYMGEIHDANVSSGNMAYVYGLGAVGILILLLACFNFMNLSMARSLERGKEAGIRKVLGAHRGNLFRQFMSEPVLLAVASCLVAFGILRFALGSVSDALGFSMSVSSAEYEFILPIFVAIAAAAGLLAGSYPALVISAFHPALVLKGRYQNSASAATLRKVLVILQFSITIALIAVTLVVSRQMHYVGHRDLGFDKESVVILHIPRDDSDERYPRIRERLLRDREVMSVSAAGDLLDGDNGSVPVYKDDTPSDQGLPMNIYGVSFGFFKTLDIDLLAGRAFQEDFATDTSAAIVINQAAAQMLGWDDPVGQHLRISDLVDGRVIGVVDDFNFASLHNRVEPLALFYSSLLEHVYVRVRPGDWSNTLAALESDWQDVSPDLPFNFTILDDNIAQLYAADRQFSRLITAFCLLTIVVACLGLYGLIASLTSQRTQEIGIRKVLGASVTSILALLSRQMLLLVLAANVIAWPLAYIFSHRWLEDFAYRIPVGVWSFIGAGAAALLVAALTMWMQTYRAASANPVDAIRYG
ncbi:MAG: ABC transporter permease [Rhodothermales bacterium]